MSDQTPVIETENSSTQSLSKEMLTTAALNAVATTGTLVGFVAFLLGVDQVQKFRTRRAAKKAAKNNPS